MAVVVSVEWANAKGLESDSYAAGHGVGNDTRAHPELGRYIFNFCLKKKKKIKAVQIATDLFTGWVLIEEIIKFISTYNIVNVQILFILTWEWPINCPFMLFYVMA